MRGRDILISLQKKLFNPYFSHIYIEKAALNYEITKEVLKVFKNSELIEINHYKDIFSRSHQNYILQKGSPKLILAVKRDNLIYEGAEMCQDFGNNYFYYTSTMMNCIYDCEYCYLQGMYTSSNIVIFVNIEEIFEEVKKLLKIHPVYLCISYDTDVLAFENVIGYTKRWIEFTKENKDLKIEIRTKSANFNAISAIEAYDNVILAWTLSPDEVIKGYENRTPILKDRILSIKQAVDKGWNVRLCFDPILYINNWKVCYSNLITTIFNEINADKIMDISIGVFRVSKDYLKRMRKQRKNSIILNYPFETVKGVCSYNNQLSENMTSYIYSLVSKYIPKEKIFIWKDR
ncbi:spore photoproduct lyase [Clostridium cavendishii DSM 21758]|uniref:Spore photoproduct lyase n=1 Tax=Clostridium cavendishii DSM 21758 TaxID=1121302 RepID=A0A1M6BDD6_9CLOT|nr:spore photoproduct lyase [Clostridium cavendishii DSM 21758]